MNKSNYVVNGIFWDAVRGETGSGLPSEIHSISKSGLCFDSHGRFYCSVKGTENRGDGGNLAKTARDAGHAHKYSRLDRPATQAAYSRWGCPHE